MDWSLMRDIGLLSCVTATQSPVDKLSFLSTLTGPVEVMYPVFLGKGVFWFASYEKCAAVSRYFYTRALMLPLLLADNVKIVGLVCAALENLLPWVSPFRRDVHYSLAVTPAWLMLASLWTVSLQTVSNRVNDSLPWSCCQGWQLVFCDVSIGFSVVGGFQRICAKYKMIWTRTSWKADLLCVKEQKLAGEPQWICTKAQILEINA